MIAATMRDFLLTLLVNAVALWLATVIVPGVEVGGGTEELVVTLAVVALVFGLVNAVIKPIIRVVAFPLYVLTFGLFALVVNALLFQLTAWLAGQLNLPFEVEGFWPAVGGAVVVSIVGVGFNAIRR